MSRLEAALLELQCTAVLHVNKSVKGKSGEELDSLNLEDLRESKAAVFGRFEDHRGCWWGFRSAGAKNSCVQNSKLDDSNSMQKRKMSYGLPR